MDKEKVTGVVLRERAKGENDKLLSILTAEHGKMVVLGKGVRSLRNKNMVAAQPFCCATYVLTKSRSGMYYISESELHEAFFDLRADLLSLALASYVCEVADHVSVEDNADVPLLRLVLNTLYAAAGKKRPTAQIKGAFELRCASVLGLSPELSCCADCGDPDAPAYWLDILGGELFCADCMSKRGHEEASVEYSGEWSRPLCPVSPELLAVLRYVISAEPTRFLSFSLPEHMEADFSAVCERYLLHHLGRGFSTLDYYKQFSKL